MKAKVDKKQKKAEDFLESFTCHASFGRFEATVYTKQKTVSGMIIGYYGDERILLLERSTPTRPGKVLVIPWTSINLIEADPVEFVTRGLIPKKEKP